MFFSTTTQMSRTIQAGLKIFHPSLLNGQSKNKMKKLIAFFALIISFNAFSQKPYVSKVWVADNGEGTYKNPILNADYSDPDAIRVGDNFYLVSSSFEDVPGLPILQSKDLVNWTIIGHALKRLPPYEHYSVPRHGEGV